MSLWTNITGHLILRLLSEQNIHVPFKRSVEHVLLKHDLLPSSTMAAQSFLTFCYRVSLLECRRLTLHISYMPGTPNMG